MVYNLSKRDLLFDIAKGIGIIFVIWGHTYCPISKYIYEFHMPFFFIIAGYFHKQEIDFLGFIRKKTKRLIIPYLLFSVIAYLFYLTWHLIFLKTGLFNYLIILNIIPYKECIIGPLWFFISLFEVALIYYFLKRLNSDTYFILIISFLLTLFGYFFLPQQFNFFFIGSSLSMMFFFSVGSELLKISRKIIISETLIKNFLLLIIILTIFLFFSKLSNGINIIINYQNSPFLVYILVALAGSYIVLLFSSMITLKIFTVIFSNIGRNSLSVFAIHFPMLEISRPIANFLLRKESTLWGITVGLLCLIFSLIASELLYKIFPKLLKSS